MIEELLGRQEDKTLEFKQNTSSLQRIVQTVIAFANTAGGTLVVGVQDKTKEVIGLEDVFQDEERLANVIADTIEPRLYPNIQMVTWRHRDLLIVTVPHSFGPFFLKHKGIEKGTFVRFGSTNRLADQDLITQIQWAKARKFFDEAPNIDCPLGEIDFELAKSLFQHVQRDFDEKTAKTLDLLVEHQSHLYPSNAAVILFANVPSNYIPSALVRLGRFQGNDKSEIIDVQDLTVPLVRAIDPIMEFIRRHTSMRAVIDVPRREEIPQYHPIIMKEAVVNALLHADYSIKGINIQIAIFDDRIEITNPGGLPLGLSFESAISGVSQLRNHVIGRVFRELHIAEQWGSGLKRMLRICKEQELTPPSFVDQRSFFRVTIYHHQLPRRKQEKWEEDFFTFLKTNQKITPREARELWDVSDKTTTLRLKRLSEEGMIVEFATSPFDPHKHYRLP